MGADATDRGLSFPTPAMGLAPVSKPVIGRIVSNDTCLRGKSASFVRHTEIDVSGTVLEGRCLVGQAFGILAPGVDDNGKAHKVRLYSLACPSDGEDGHGKIISTTTKRVIDERTPQKKGDDPDDHRLFLGVCSNFLCDLGPGDEVRVTGPNGKRFLLPEAQNEHNYVFVATGTGIAPFRGMVRQLLERDATTAEIHLIMGAPYTTDLLYDDLFVRLQAEHANFHYHTAISRETQPDGSPGQYVDQVLDRGMDVFHPALANKGTLLYVCGLAGMQSGLFKVMARHGIHDGYFSVKDSLRDVDPADWDLREIRRGVRLEDRCMVEVY